MAHSDQTGEVHSERDIQQGSLPEAVNTVRTHFSPFENTVFGANFSSISRTDMPVGYSSVMIYMSRDIFRVPLSTLQQLLEAGGLGLIEVSNKFIINFLTRCKTQIKLGP